MNLIAASAILVALGTSTAYGVTQFKHDNPEVWTQYYPASAGRPVARQKGFRKVAATTPAKKVKVRQDPDKGWHDPMTCWKDKFGCLHGLCDGAMGPGVDPYCHSWEDLPDGVEFQMRFSE